MRENKGLPESRGKKEKQAGKNGVAANKAFTAVLSRGPGADRSISVQRPINRGREMHNRTYASKQRWNRGVSRPRMRTLCQ